MKPMPVDPSVCGKGGQPMEIFYMATAGHRVVRRLWFHGEG